MSENTQNGSESTTRPTVTHQTIFINQSRGANSIGVAGFVLALIALVFGWVPILGWILWVLGLIFSFVGVFKQPRGFAVAGLIISMIGLIMMLVVFTAIAVFASTFL